MLSLNSAAILVAIIMSLIVTKSIQNQLNIKFDIKALLVLVLVPTIFTALVSRNFMTTCIAICSMLVISILKDGIPSMCAFACVIPLWVSILAKVIQGGTVGIGTQYIGNDAVLLISLICLLVALIKQLKSRNGVDAEETSEAEEQPKSKKRNGKGLGVKLIGVFKSNPSLAFCTCFGAVAIGVFLIAVIFV